MKQDVSRSLPLIPPLLGPGEILEMPIRNPWSGRIRLRVEYGRFGLAALSLNALM
jgi:hypothetical protein